MQMNNDLIEKITAKCGTDLLEVLDDVKNSIADARNGDATTESRKLAIEMIDKMLYNKIKNLLKPEEDTKQTEQWL
jgi:hypothetical protein